MSKFELAAEEVKTLTKKPSDGDLLKLYGLYKQATVGDVNTTKPGIFSPKERAKWDAWNENKGKAKETAESEYVAFVEGLLGRTL